VGGGGPGGPPPRGMDREGARLGGLALGTRPLRAPCGAGVREDETMKRALPALVFAGLVGAVYADPLFTRRLFSGRDLVAYNHPMEQAIHDAWARGRLQVWMAQISGGTPL